MESSSPGAPDIDVGGEGVDSDDGAHAQARGARVQRADPGDQHGGRPRCGEYLAPAWREYIFLFFKRINPTASCYDSSFPNIFLGATGILREKYFLKVNKPASIPVHPCGRYRHNTVVFILAKVKCKHRFYQTRVRSLPFSIWSICSYKSNLLNSNQMKSNQKKWKKTKRNE